MVGLSKLIKDNIELSVHRQYAHQVNHHRMITLSGQIVVQVRFEIEHEVPIVDISEEELWTEKTSE